MPLIRFQVRNEFGLGDPELHRGANKDDPKAILDGVAVAGLVGILRQLGDLAELAAEVFHDLHEQVMATAARSRKMITRVQGIEGALPTLENSVLAQTSHIHFAYTAGFDWRADIQTEQNHLVHGDVPQFIMDSYEQCRDPPRLFLLDKFDAAGAGACLRRYSDPSSFTAAWAGSEQAKAEKVQGVKRANKSKKKGSQRRSGESRHAASISRRYSRLQFASPDTDEQSVAAETFSTSNMRSKSKLANRSLSLDSEPGLNYVERVLDINSSMGSEEPEHSISSTSRLNTWSNDTHAPILPDEQNGEGAGNDSPCKLLQADTACGSSSVTWDEKTEIVKPISPPVETIPQGRDQASEALPVSFDQSKLEEAAASLASVDQDNIVFDVEHMPQTLSCGKQFEEVTSEPDNYMDALNTIESETETDCECQTKWELELQSEFKNTVMESGTGGTHDVAAQNSDSSDVESLSASHSSSNKEMAPNNTCSIISESLAHAQPPQVSSMASNLDCSTNTGLCEDVRSLNGFESVSGKLPTESSVPNSQENKIMDNSCISSESPKNSDIPSVKFWTNGGLLGLEPSKPPDFVVSNAVSQNSVTSTNSAGCNLSHHTVMPELHHDVSVGKSTTLVKPIEKMEQNSTIQRKREGSPHIVKPSDLHNPPPDQLAGRRGNLVRCEYSTSLHDKRDENMSAEQNYPEFTTAVSETKHEKLKDMCPSGIFSHTHGAELPVISNTVVQSSESTQNNTKVSSGLSGITQRSLLNGLGRKTSLFPSAWDSSEPLCTNPKKPQERLHHNEQKNWQNGVVAPASHGSSPKEQPHLQSLENPTSSPPLEHMKISFHPINGMETSKLKLEFPNGHRFHESIQDVIFPSFQLLPEPTVPMQDMGSESDDDTFYRSSPYPSEDLLSLRSESNSEQWESTEMTGSKDDEIYDALRRVPSHASISSSLELEGITHHSADPTHEFGTWNAENGRGSLEFESGPLLDLPSFYVVNSQGGDQQKEKSDSEPKGLVCSALQYSNELAPPPPLPPLQWRMMKPGFALAEHEQQIIPEGNSQLNDLQVEKSDTTKPKLVQLKNPHISEADSQENDLQVQTPITSLQLKPAQPNKTHNEEKLNGSREPNQSSNGKELDEREDFLHQIRTKSFNLKRTVPTRSSSTSEPTTNIKVAAILEKANAIRQAFTGGDDENWSDG